MLNEIEAQDIWHFFYGIALDYESQARRLSSYELAWDFSLKKTCTRYSLLGEKLLHMSHGFCYMWHVIFELTFKPFPLGSQRFDGYDTYKMVMIIKFFELNFSSVIY